MKDVMSPPAQLVLFGGPAGSGKSTLARAWCATRKRAGAILDLHEWLPEEGRPLDGQHAVPFPGDGAVT